MSDVTCRNCHENSGLVRDVAADVYGGPRVVPCFCYRTRTALARLRAVAEAAPCDVCHGKGWWLSKEGAEIPCDFCAGAAPKGDGG